MKRCLLVLSFLACTAIVEHMNPVQCQLITLDRARKRRSPSH
ncbi:hypothetical protein HNQ50_004085 [Silvimonas terrae]|uniref:Uncharacterized protein n=1 Tax=Silvimonas terrae TaxID=300266 RepID=A0A840RMK8_9NEIS|nr:hypothetical protein [Silvimonas terrae]MBB5193331.1 hypothetical protein [Silvimonas terrae]